MEISDTASLVLTIVTLIALIVLIETGRIVRVRMDQRQQEREWHHRREEARLQIERDRLALDARRQELNEEKARQGHGD